ncbi:hypothetical protein [Mycolicibacterium monacense]|uniref:hypothetical protein n=1 Tax=Mycolicibacterium monacense TaxID=85693 RepID=UPI000B27FC8F|nr:hypothetical protein [Mycolicibacterium monacense]
MTHVLDPEVLKRVELLAHRDPEVIDESVRRSNSELARLVRGRLQGRLPDPSRGR